MTTHERRSLTLSLDEWATLEALAAEANAIPSQGRQTETPSWRTLIKRIAQRALAIEQPLRTQLNHASPAIAETYLAAMQPAADPANTYYGIAPEIELRVQAASDAEAMQALRAELIRQIEQDPDWFVLTGWPAP